MKQTKMMKGRIGWEAHAGAISLKRSRATAFSAANSLFSRLSFLGSLEG